MTSHMEDQEGTLLEFELRSGFSVTDIEKAEMKL